MGSDSMIFLPSFIEIDPSVETNNEVPHCPVPSQAIPDVGTLCGLEAVLKACGKMDTEVRAGGR
jgi:hypothetical protein